MEGSIIFYTYGSTLELNGQQFEAGRLTEDLLNLSPDDYHPPARTDGAHPYPYGHLRACPQE